MIRNMPHVVLLIGMVAWQFSCSSAPPEGCEKHVREKLQPGIRSDIAESELKKCRFTVTMDPKITRDPTAKTLYGDKRVQRGLISERTQVLIKLDSDNKVASADVTTGLIGP
jgi:hypothetical protein